MWLALSNEVLKADAVGVEVVGPECGVGECAVVMKVSEGGLGA